MSYFELLGTIWSYLELFGAIWSYLELFRANWTNLELFGPILSYLKIFGPFPTFPPDLGLGKNALLTTFLLSLKSALITTSYIISYKVFKLAMNKL